MRYLYGPEEKKALECLAKAAEISMKSSCLRSRCGSVIVKDDEVIGKGFNSPPLNERLDHCFKDELPDGFKSDRTCCIHAEQRAIMDALRENPLKLQGSRLYFLRLNERGNPTRAGEPYCTICSKMALDSGISEFALWRSQGICVYDTREYNLLSFKHKGDSEIRGS